MRVMTAVLVLGLVGCKKHESPGTAGSAGSGSAGSALVGSGATGSAVGSGAAVGAGSAGTPDPWAGSGDAPGSAASAGSAGSAMVGSGATGSATSAPAAGGKLGSDVMDKESIGGVALGDGPDKVTAALGKPDKKTKPEEEAATGDVVQVWSYGASQVTLSKREGRWGVTAFQVSGPTAWQTSRGIHIGSTKAEVLAAYDGEAQDDGVLVGSSYGGEMFTIAAGKVTQIFLGAMAE